MHIQNPKTILLIITHTLSFVGTHKKMSVSASIAHLDDDAVDQSKVHEIIVTPGEVVTTEEGFMRYVTHTGHPLHSHRTPIRNHIVFLHNVSKCTWFAVVTAPIWTKLAFAHRLLAW